MTIGAICLYLAFFVLDLAVFKKIGLWWHTALFIAFLLFINAISN
jgi:hypothetical protein